MVEKPMAMNAKEGQTMLDAAKKHGKQLIVGFQYRFDAAIASSFATRSTAGSFGKILYVRARRCAGAAFPTGASSAARNSRAAGR